MKCPHCNSEKVQGTNIGERTFARVAAVGAGLFTLAVNPVLGIPAMITANKVACEYREYICLNCKKEFRERR